MAAHQALTAAWEANRPAIGGWITTSSEMLIDAYGAAGYDYVGIDCQHSTIDEGEAARLLRRLRASPFAMFARVSRNEPALIGRLADAGAEGIIVPLVNSAEEAAAAVDAIRFPPNGRRSFGPGRSDMGATTAEIESRVSVFVMIETVDGLANVAEICAVPGLTGVYVGPGDLSISLGLDPWEGFTTDQVEEPVATVREAAEANGVVLGIDSGGGADAARWARLGCRLISLGSDMSIFNAAIRADRGVALDTGGATASASASPYAAR